MAFGASALMVGCEPPKNATKPAKKASGAGSTTGGGTEVPAPKGKTETPPEKKPEAAPADKPAEKPAEPAKPEEAPKAEEPKADAPKADEAPKN